MIAWTEQEPDFKRAPVDDLISRLPFTTAAAVAINPGPWPLVVASRRVLDTVWAHLGEQRIEMGGLLIGSVHDLPGNGGRYVIAVRACVRSAESEGTCVSLRMAPDVWERARSKAGDGCFVVGWYHSHPNLGVFFSDTDRCTQRAFFSQPHSLGLVVDPFRKEEKWFIGAKSEELSPQQVLRHH